MQSWTDVSGTRKKNSEKRTSRAKQDKGCELLESHSASVNLLNSAFLVLILCISNSVPDSPKN